MTSNIKIRAATSSDREFIFSLSANLADVADLSWHSREAVQTMQMVICRYVCKYV